MRAEAIAVGEAVSMEAGGQLWELSWHPDPTPPVGKRHGSSGVCVTQKVEVVLVGVDWVTWGLPGGRPEGSESWEETLRREVLEEACAHVTGTQLLGFGRSVCLAGHEQGLVLIRSFWRAEVEAERFEPHFETTHRRLVTTSELRARPPIPGLLDPLIRRVLAEARVL